MPVPSLKFSAALCAVVLLAPLAVLCETVNVNTATEAQLDGLLGLGPATFRAAFFPLPLGEGQGEGSAAMR